MLTINKIRFTFIYIFGQGPFRIFIKGYLCNENIFNIHPKFIVILEDFYNHFISKQF